MVIFYGLYVHLCLYCVCMSVCLIHHLACLYVFVWMSSFPCFVFVFACISIIDCLIWSLSALIRVFVVVFSLRHRCESTFNLFHFSSIPLFHHFHQHSNALFVSENVVL